MCNDKLTSDTIILQRIWSLSMRIYKWWHLYKRISIIYERHWHTEPRYTRITSWYGVSLPVRVAKIYRTFSALEKSGQILSEWSRFSEWKVSRSLRFNSPPPLGITYIISRSNTSRASRARDSHASVSFVQPLRWSALVRNARSAARVPSLRRLKLSAPTYEFHSRSSSSYRHGLSISRDKQTNKYLCREWRRNSGRQAGRDPSTREGERESRKGIGSENRRAREGGWTRHSSYKFIGHSEVLSSSWRGWGVSLTSNRCGRSTEMWREISETDHRQRSSLKTKVADMRSKENSYRAQISRQNFKMYNFHIIYLNPLNDIDEISYQYQWKG